MTVTPYPCIYYYSVDCDVYTQYAYTLYYTLSSRFGTRAIQATARCCAARTANERHAEFERNRFLFCFVPFCFCLFFLLRSLKRRAGETIITNIRVSLVYARQTRVSCPVPYSRWSAISCCSRRRCRHRHRRYHWRRHSASLAAAVCVGSPSARVRRCLRRLRLSSRASPRTKRKVSLIFSVSRAYVFFRTRCGTRFVLVFYFFRSVRPSRRSSSRRVPAPSVRRITTRYTPSRDARVRSARRCRCAERSRRVLRASVSVSCSRFNWYAEEKTPYTDGGVQLAAAGQYFDVAVLTSV